MRYDKGKKHFLYNSYVHVYLHLVHNFTKTVGERISKFPIRVNISYRTETQMSPQHNLLLLLPLNVFITCVKSRRNQHFIPTQLKQN